MNITHLRILTDMLTGDESLSERIMALPYFIRECNDQFLDEIIRLTGHAPGLWAASPSFDDDGNDLTLKEDHIDLPFSAWANRYNQEELRSIFPSIMLPEYVIVDSAVDETLLRRAFDIPPNISDAWIISGGLRYIEELKWFAVAVDPDAIRLLFICEPSKKAWIDEMRHVLGEPDEFGR